MSFFGEMKVGEVIQVMQEDCSELTAGQSAALPGCLHEFSEDSSHFGEDAPDAQNSRARHSKISKFNWGDFMQQESGAPSPITIHDCCRERMIKLFTEIEVQAQDELKRFFLWIKVPSMIDNKVLINTPLGPLFRKCLLKMALNVKIICIMLYSKYFEAFSVRASATRPPR
jgi:hypothetical protein